MARAKNTSIYLHPDAQDAVETRGGSRSEVINRDLLRLYDLYRYELAELTFSEGEAGLIVDVLNGTLTAHASQAAMLWAEVADGIRLDHLDEKWQVDGEQLVATLKALRLAQCLAIVDAAERYWAAVGAGRKPAVEDYLPVRS